MKIEYHENDKKKGIKYDFSLIRKEFKKLKIPKDVYNPLTIPLEWSKFNVLLSPRSKGKTTNILLLGLIFLSNSILIVYSLETSGILILFFLGSTNLLTNCSQSLKSDFLGLMEKNSKIRSQTP